MTGILLTQVKQLILHLPVVWGVGEQSTSAAVSDAGAVSCQKQRHDLMATAPCILEQKCLAELCCSSGERCNLLDKGWLSAELMCFSGSGMGLLVSELIVAFGLC